MPKRHQKRPAQEMEHQRHNASKSTEITTGNYKKPEKYKEQAEEHQATNKLPQHAKVPPLRDPHPGLVHEADSRRRAAEREPRSGTDSNARDARKGDRLHDRDAGENEPQGPPITENFSHDLTANYFAGENHGLRDPSLTWIEIGPSAYDIKGLQQQLPELTDDILKNIPLVPEGTRMEQGAKYIDLLHLEQGEVTAIAQMKAEPGHAYVPKKLTDYMVWDRLLELAHQRRP